MRNIDVGLILVRNKECIIFNFVFFLILVSPIVFGAYVLYQKNIWLLSQLEYIEPRFARLKGVEPELEYMNKQIDDINQGLALYVREEKGDPNQEGNEILQNVRKILEVSGFEANSAQVVLDGKSDKFKKYNVIIKGEASVGALMSSLSGLKDLKPILIIDSMSVQSTGLSQPHVAQRIVIQLNLSSIRSRL